jgi:DNA-binding transcriptional LysR family regulator
VVTVECLAALDHLFWLRTGARAAEVLRCNQSTISRHARVCQDLFGVAFFKHSAEWCVQGDDALLNAERRVHQAYRWSRNLPLRLDAQHWVAAHCENLDLPLWRKGNLNYLGYEQPLALIKNRILDAWLCSSPDHPRDPELCALPLCTMPAYLVVKQGHPLLGLRSPRFSDVKAYPLLPLPAHAFPVFEAMLSSLGLGGAHVHSSDDADAGQGAPAAVEDLLVGIASPLTLQLYGPDWVVLPLQLPLAFGDVLVVRGEYALHPRTRGLVDALLCRVADRARAHDAVKLLDPYAGSALPDPSGLMSPVGAPDEVVI